MPNSLASTTVSPRKKSRGQSLVEFVGVFPVLFLAAVAGGTMVVGTQQCHTAAVGMNAIALNKLKMADQDGAVGGGTLSGYVSGGNFKGPFKSSAAIDSVSVSTVDTYTDLAVGSKQFTPLLTTFVPGFTVRTLLVVNHNLLQSASSGSATQKSSTTAWVPGGTPLPPPWP